MMITLTPDFKELVEESVEQKHKPHYAAYNISTL